MNIKCNQPDILVKHTNPTFKLEFKEAGEVKEVSEEVGKKLLENKNLFTEVKRVDKETERKKRGSSFKQLN